MPGSGAGIPMQQQDFTTLRAVCHELDQQVAPSRFVKAQQSDGATIHMGLRTVSIHLWLELSWSAAAPRFHPCPPPPRQGAGSTLAQQFHHGLRGLALTALRQPPWERIVQLEFGKRPGAVVERRVVLELMGRHSNLFLLDATDRIMAMGRQVKPRQSRVRPLGCGDRYAAPPPAPGRLPNGEESCASWRTHLQLAPLPVAQALWRRYGGISPGLARQLCGEAGVDATICVTTLTGDQWQALYRQWQLWLAALESRQFRFQLEGDQGYRVWPAPPVGQGGSRSTDGPDQSVGLALAAFHGRHLRHARLQQDHQRLAQVLCKAMAGEQRLLGDVQQRLAAVADHTTLQRLADRLMCCPDLQHSGLTTLLAADPMGDLRSPFPWIRKKPSWPMRSSFTGKPASCAGPARRWNHGWPGIASAWRGWNQPMTSSCSTGASPLPTSSRSSWRSWRMNCVNWDCPPPPLPFLQWEQPFPSPSGCAAPGVCGYWWGATTDRTTASASRRRAVATSGFMRRRCPAVMWCSR